MWFSRQRVIFRSVGFGVALAVSSASGVLLSPKSTRADERSPDIAQIERDIAEAGRTGALPHLQKTWLVHFQGITGPGERISLEVLPAIPVRDGDPESKARFDRLRDQIRQVFDIHRQDTGVFSVVLRDGSKLLTSQGMVIPLKFVFRRTMITSAETNFAGYGQAGCAITTQFFATGTREPLRLGQNPSLARFVFNRDGVATFAGYQGQHGEFVVFQRQTNDPVEVRLEYTDPELGQVTQFAPVSLDVCVASAAPPPPPPPVVEMPPPPPVYISEPALPPLPKGFTWGVSGGLGLATVSEPELATGRVGGGLTLSFRAGYFLHPQFALLAEPRVGFLVGPSFLGTKAALSALGQLHFARSWVASVGPAIGYASTDRYGGGGLAGGFLARFGADVPLRNLPSGRTRAVSLRLELEPLFVGLTNVATATSTVGALTTFVFSVGYEQY
jgi:hypothetical protein